MANNFNDLTSSVRVGQKTKITLWENDVGNGRSFVLTDDRPCFTNDSNYLIKLLNRQVQVLLLNFTMVLKEDVPGCMKTAIIQE